MSALPPKADIGTQSRHVRFVPKADSCSAAIDRTVIGAGEHIVDNLANIRLILDHQNALAHAGSTCRSTMTGSVKVNVEPWPTWDSTQILPPCISMMRFDIASTKPVPPFLRVMALSAC